MIPTKDKTDIVVALRECARGIEQSLDPDLTLKVMQSIGTELLVLALKHGPLLVEIEGENAPPEHRETRAEHLENLIRVEIAAIADTIAKLHEHRITEGDLLNERLTRQFDPYAAWNEAINRAIAKKLAAKELVVGPSPQQKFAFEKFQFPSTMNALRNAGKSDPQPTVHRIGDADVAEMNEALKAGNG